MTPKEEVEKFIQKRMKQERDKMMSGLKNQYTNWCFCDDYKDNRNDLEYLTIEYQLAKKFLKERSLDREFEQWKEVQKNK